MTRLLLITILAMAVAGPAVAQDKPPTSDDGHVDPGPEQPLAGIGAMVAAAADSPLGPIFQGLGDGDVEVRTQAVRDLREYGKGDVSSGEKTLLLTAAGLEHQDIDLGTTDISTELVVAAGDLGQEHLSMLWDHFDGYSAGARLRVLDQLARMDSPLAAATWLDLAMAYKNSLDGLPTGTLGDDVPMGATLWPELLVLLDHESLRHDVAYLCLEHLVSGRIIKARPAVALRMLELSAELREQLMPMQQADGVAWRHADDYAEPRATAALALDVLGHLGGNATVDELRACLAYSDPRLQYFAVTSLLRLGEEVDDDHIAAVAADPEMRGWLFGELAERDEIKRIPRKYRKQEALAEADMVHWLVYPTELGRAPDEIELMEVVTDGKGADAQDFYLFRFRTHEPHWAAEDGWTAGVSGPFRRGDQPTADALGGTFSTFTPWEDKTPEQHVADIRALLENAWQENALAE